MKTSLKTILKTTVLALTLTTSLSAWASGDGRSGDDQAGISIPAKLDRALTLPSFKNAVDICKTQAAESLIRQMLLYRGDLQGHYVIQKTLDTTSYIFSAKSNDSEEVSTFGLSLSIGMRGNILNDPSVLWITKELPRASLNPIAVPHDVYFAVFNASYNKTHLVGGINLSIEFQKDSGRDNFRNYRPDLLLVTRYTIQETPLMNDKMQTEFRISGTDFQQCLQNNLN